MNTKHIISIITLCTSIGINAANLSLGPVFTDDMVLQRNSTVPVWGTATPGKEISVQPSWDTRHYTTVAAPDGKWRVKITTDDTRGPQSISVAASGESLTVSNVLLGEVWMLGGQSNMSMPLEGYDHQPVEGSTEAILTSASHPVRFFNVPPLAAYRQLDTIDNAHWQVAAPATTGSCSAVGWFFAKIISQVLDVPVGLVNVSFSGSNLEAWMSPDACSQFSNISVPPQSDETSPWIGNVPSLLYNGMMHPVEGYGIAGMLFYQGESNIFDIPSYSPMLSAAVADWRMKWDRGEWPFYIVQIAPYDYTEWNFFTPQWPEISAYMREAQLKCSHDIPNSGLVVTLDSGTDYVIHPPMKRPVGERLAMLALADNYGLTGFEAVSPEFERMEVVDGKAIIHFANLHKGLTSYGNPLTLFEIAGDNRVFVKAEAHINEADGTVVVSSRLVSEPKAVRYAFRNYVEAELFGTGGHPVSSFRSDNWE